MRKYKKIIFLFVVLVIGENVQSQNTTSPYSILGIGDIETKDFGRWYGMGSASIALTNPYYINASNPASLMGLDQRMMNFDMANRGKTSKFMYATSDTFTATTKDFAVRRISLAFKPNKKWAFSIGLKPFSSINYLLQETNIAADNSLLLTKTIDGSGGLNQVYFSYARSISKNFSIGLTSSYYFGSANIKTEYAGPSVATAIARQSYNIMNAYQFQLGLQYMARFSPALSQHIGFTLSNPSVVTQRLETAYYSNDVVVKVDNETKKDFQLPLTAGLGYALIFNDRLTISADVVFSNWKKQKVDYPNSYTTPSFRLSTGLEYVSKRKIKNYEYENWYLQAGASVEKSYLKVLGKNLYGYGFTIGFGKNLSSMMSIYSGYEIGKNGNKKYGQITEKYNQFIMGFTLKEFWFNYRKYGRYQ